MVEPIEIALLALAVLLTSILSGVFAMGGGVLLLAVLLNLLPVTQAMIYHGMIQFFSNGFRAILSFRSINYKIMSFYIAGSLIGASLLFQVVYAPKKGPLLFTVGLLTLFGPHLKFVNFDITSKLGALVSGVIISWLNTLIGATGPILNMFFLKSDLSRFEVIATKSAIQTVAHVIKVVFYLGLFSKMPTQNFDQFDAALILMCLITFAGGWIGKVILGKMSDDNFRRIGFLIISGFGLVFTLQGAYLIWS